jgi:hypothetical protein
MQCPVGGLMIKPMITGSQKAKRIKYKPTGGAIEAKDVQGALEQVEAEIVAVTAGNETTATPTVTKAILTGNEGTTEDIVITNYVSTFTYTLAPGNADIATAIRAGNTITVTFVAGEYPNGSSTDIVVSAFDPSKSYSASTTLNVTTYRVLVADDAIQIVDFDLVDASALNMDMTSGLLATADGAVFVSDSIDQEAEDNNWIEYTPSITLSNEAIDSSVITVIQDLYSAESFPSAQPWLLVDAVGNQFERAVTPVQSAGDMDNMTDLDSHDFGTFHDRMFGADISSNGLYAVSCDGQDSFHKGVMSTAWDMTTLGTVEEIPVNFAGLPKAYRDQSEICAMAFSFDGMFVYLCHSRLVDGEVSSSGTGSWGVMKCSLDGPWDLTTLNYVCHFQPEDYKGFDRDSMTANIAVSIDETCLYVAGGFAIYDATGYVLSFGMSTPGDLNTITFLDESSDSAFLCFDVAISPRKDVGLSVIRYDNGAREWGVSRVTMYNNAILDFKTDQYGLGGEGDPYGIIVSPDGKHVFLYGRDKNHFTYLDRTSAPIWDSPIYYTYDKTGITNEIEGVFLIPEKPTVTIASHPSDAALIDLSTAPASIIDNEPSLWAIGDAATKIITYEPVRCDARHVKFKIEADEGFQCSSFNLELGV